MYAVSGSGVVSDLSIEVSGLSHSRHRRRMDLSAVRHDEDRESDSQNSYIVVHLEKYHLTILFAWWLCLR